MYSKEQIIELLDALIGDVKDAQQDYFDDHRNVVNRDKAYGVRIGFTRVVELIEGTKQIVEEEW